MVASRKEAIQLHRDFIDMAGGIISECIGLRELHRVKSSGSDLVMFRERELLVGIRIRDREEHADKFGHEFTLLEHGPSRGNAPRESEIEQIKNGKFCDWFLYGHGDKRRKIIEPWGLIYSRAWMDDPRLLDRYTRTKLNRRINNSVFRVYRFDMFPRWVIPFTSELIVPRPRFFEIPQPEGLAHVRP